MRAYNIRRDLTSRMLEGGREGCRQAGATGLPYNLAAKNSDFGNASALMFVPENHVVGQPFPVAVPNNATGGNASPTILAFPESDLKSKGQSVRRESRDRSRDVVENSSAGWRDQNNRR